MPAKAVIHPAVIRKDQLSRQLPIWRFEFTRITRKHMARQAPAATPQIMNSGADRWTH